MKKTISYASSTLRFLMISLIISLSVVRTTAQVFEFRRIAAGADSAEIYISCQWYQNDTGFMGGLFYSQDHGQTLSVQFKNTWPFGILYNDFYGDLLKGTLYAYSGLGVSHDYGLTWEIHNCPFTQEWEHGGGGSVSGEVYLAGYDSGHVHKLYYGTNFGDSMYLKNAQLGSLHRIEAGSLPGELFALKYPYYGSGNQDTLGLAFSHDYGQSFVVNYLDTPIVKNLFQYTLTHGPDTGELYLIGLSFSAAKYHILHTSDYGKTFSLNYITPEFTFGWDEFSFVAGREPGSFYILQMYPCEDFNNCIEIHYSSDYGVTYTTYYHELDSTFTGLPREISLPELKVYPNPAKDQVTFQFNEEVNHAETHLCVFDLEGKLMDEQLIEPGEREIILDTRRYAPGIYCYMLNQATPGAQGKFIIVR